MSSGFTFGGAPNTTTTSATKTTFTGFGFGLGQPTSSFGTPVTTTAGTGFGFGSSIFGAGPAVTTTTASAATQPSATGIGGFAFPGFKSAPSSTSTPSLGSLVTPITTTATGFGFGTSVFGTGPAVTTTTASAATQPSATGIGSFAFPGFKSAPLTTSTPSLGSLVTPITTTATGFGFGTNVFGTGPAAAATVTTASASTQPSAPAVGGFAFPGFNSSTSSLFAPSSSSVVPAITTTGIGSGGTIFGAGPTAATTTAPAATQPSATGMGGFAFPGIQSTPSATPAPALGSFVTPVTTSGTGFGFGSSVFGAGTAAAATVTTASASTQPSAGAAGGFAFPGFKSTSSATPAPALGSLVTPVTTSATGFGFGSSVFGAGTTAAATVTTASASTQPSASTVGGLAFPGFKSAASSSFAPSSSSVVPAVTTTDISSGATSFGAAPSLAATTTSAATQPIATTVGGFSFPEPVATTASAPVLAPTLLPTSIAPPVTTVAAVVSFGASVDAAKPITYQQLEDLINKWTADLEEQERLFLTQATQINAWDRVLMENSDKILKLYDDVDQLENEQRRMDYELDFVAQQQNELTQIVEQLEKSLALEQTDEHDQRRGDVRREEMVQLQTAIDCQLKQVGRDVTQLIDRINTANDVTGEADPLRQIAAILTKQMDSLQWLDGKIDQAERRSRQLQMDLQRRRTETQGAFQNIRHG